MGGCGNCCGSCGLCGELVLAPGEIDMLKKLSQIPFLPVAREAYIDTPVYLGDDDYSNADASQILRCLEKRSLITIDYDKPLKGFDYEKYPLRGSIALTAKGQEVIETLEIQGLQEE